MKTIHLARLAAGLSGVALAAMLTGIVPPAAAQQPGPSLPRRTGDRYVQTVRPILVRYCAGCHMNGEAEAGIAFDRFRTQTEALRGGRSWLRVRDAVQGRIMPPEDEPQPSPDERVRLAAWVDNDFLAAQRAGASGTAPIAIRRLNRGAPRATARWPRRASHSRITTRWAVGAALALPWMESLSTVARAAGAGAGAGAGISAAPPVRMGFWYVPNGVHLPAWFPQQEGVLVELPETLRPLVKLLDHREAPVRLLAIRFLALAGRDAREAIPVLERMRDNHDAEVRKQAEAACKRIRKDATGPRT